MEYDYIQEGRTINIKLICVLIRKYGNLVGTLHLYTCSHTEKHFQTHMGNPFPLYHASIYQTHYTIAHNYPNYHALSSPSPPHTQHALMEGTHTYINLYAEPHTQ